MYVDHSEYQQLSLFCEQYIRRNCLYFGKFPGKNPNKTLTRIFNVKRALYNTEFNLKCSKMIIYQIQTHIGHFDFQLCGLETGCIPMLIGIPMVLQSYGVNINAFSVKKQPKEYGIRNRIEGQPNDKPILLIDDIYNSGSTITACKKYLKEQNLSNFYAKTISILCHKNTENHIALYNWNIFKKDNCVNNNTQNKNL